MPELPEVETTRRGLSPGLINQTIANVVVRNRQLRYPVNDEFENHLKDNRIVNLSRRAKYLIVQLNRGFLLIHLGMSGHLRLIKPSYAASKHDHIDIILSNGNVLRYNDPRRFGLMLWSSGIPQEHPLLNKLGPEPLESAFDGDYLWSQSRKRKLAVKNFIMDNHTVVGVGNIYAQESLFAAGINPQKKACDITHKHYDKLATAIKNILTKAIEQGGTTLKDFYASDGKPGYFSQSLMVYGRQGQTCHLCQQLLTTCVIGQRTTVYCAQCQK